MLAMMVCILASCSDGGSDNPVEPTPKPEEIKTEITIDSGIVSNGLSFGVEGSEQSVSFSVNANWTLSVASTTSGATWCKASATSGSKGTANVKFTVDENTGYDDRSVSVTIKAGSVSKTFTITQKGADALLVTTDKYEVAQEGGQIEIEVKANIDYQMEISEDAKSWITEASSRVLTTSKHKLDIAMNENAEKREGEITFKSDNKIETVKVYQTGGTIILLSQNDYSVNYEDTIITVDVKSNVDFGIQMPDVDWIKDISSTRGMSSHTLKFSISSNYTNKDRSSQVVLYEKNTQTKETIKITQSKAELLILNLKSAGTLYDELAEKIYDIKLLKIVGTINGDDIYYLRRMAGYEFSQGNLVGKLKMLDLADASIVEGGNWYYMGYNEKKEYTKNNVLGNYMFSECKLLEVLILPNNVNEIGDRAMIRCNNLKEIVIPNSIKHIGEYAFCACSSLEEVQLPNSIKTLGEGVFSDCKKLKSILLPPDIQTIEAYSFSECDSLYSVQMGDNVKYIGEYAFLYCTNLFEVKMSSKIEIIKHHAFQTCSNLREVILYDNLKIIEYSTFFKNEKLETVIIPSTITDIGESAFIKCDNLKSVYCYATTPPKIYFNDSFWDEASFPVWSIYPDAPVADKYRPNRNLYVPKRCGEIYKNAQWNKMFGKIIEIE